MARGIEQRGLERVVVLDGHCAEMGDGAPDGEPVVSRGRAGSAVLKAGLARAVFGSFASPLSAWCVGSSNGTLSR